jgi:hypothetical protein
VNESKSQVFSGFFLGFRFFRFSLFSVSNFPNSAADNQGTNAPRLCFFSAFALILSRFYFVSVSSLSHLSLIFRAQKRTFSGHSFVAISLRWRVCNVLQYVPPEILGFEIDSFFNFSKYR